MMTYVGFRLSYLAAALFVAASLMSQSAYSSQLSNYTAVKVQRAIALQQEDKWQDAAVVLENLPTLTGFDLAFVQRMLGGMYWQLDEPKKAIDALKLAVDTNKLEANDQRSAERMLADLLLSQSRYEEALSRYYPLVKPTSNESENNVLTPKEQADIWFRVAQAHYQIQQMKSSLSAVNHHLALVAPKVPSLSLKLITQIQLSRWKSTVSTLKQLIAIDPNNKTWWLQLTGSYQRLKLPKEMLNTLVLAQRQGIALSSSEKQMMAQLYQQQGAPEKAAALMHQLNKEDASVTSLVMEAGYWQQSKEWDEAIAAWLLAAQQDNQYRLSVAQLQLQRGHYRDALESLALVSSKEHSAQVALSQAMAFDKLGDIDNALVQASRANEIEPTSQSQSWIEYLNHKRNTLNQAPHSPN
ncbi:tetratricopeptide repeat protein [Enterovibrio calviensis]|uniref:tetratricopeptide repeat protein n=1 Tax=Enterovibrio calviensis TaxID=91359 RepID=UPI00054CF34A|nr:tetratricopeptide repeat protein [Enterovibrio calviensis]